MGILGDIITSGVNAGMTVWQNQQQQEFDEYMSEKEFAQNKEMYNMQYEDSVEMYERQLRDSIAQWNRENEYNTPTAQAERMRAAGLNPDFQNMDSGNAGSASMPSMSPPDYPKYNRPTTQFKRPEVALDLAVGEVLDILSLGYDLDMRAAAAADANFGVAERAFDLVGGDAYSGEGTDLSRLGFLSGRQKNYMRGLFEAYGQSRGFKARQAKQEAETRGHEASIQDINSDPRYGPGMQVIDAYAELQKIMNDAELEFQRTRKKQAKFDSDKLDNMDAEVIGQAETARAESDLIQKEVSEYTNKLYQEIQSWNTGDNAVFSPVLEMLKQKLLSYLQSDRLIPDLGGRGLQIGGNKMYFPPNEKKR